MSKLPRLRARRIGGVSAMAAVLDIEMPDGDEFTIAFTRGSKKMIFLAASDEEIAAGNEMHRAALRSAVVPQDTLFSTLSGLSALGFEYLYRSLRDGAPARISELRRDGDALAQLCQRDEDCNDFGHVWITVLSDTDRVPIWHVNLLNGSVVPPQPLLAEREGAR